MCCGKNCLFFIPVRMGTIIFGYILAVMSAVGTLVCMGFEIYYGVMIITLHSELYLLNLILQIIVTTEWLLECASCFVCTVLLLVGILQNKPNLIVTFLIYGMIQVAMFIVIFILLHTETSFFEFNYLIIALCIEGLFILCLYMVYMSYQNLIELKLRNPPPSNPMMRADPNFASGGSRIQMNTGFRSPSPSYCYAEYDVGPLRN